jgi:hypothetical protein
MQPAIKLAIMKRNLHLGLILLLFTVMSVPALAQDTSRSGYSIFKPMPRALMREEMEIDRPNITETPHTLEAGHFEYEADLFKYRRETTKETSQRLSLYNQANLKFGILTNTALQVIVQSYGKETNKDLTTGETHSTRGFGDITIRVKQNLLGNYKGNFSLALMPYIKLPTNRYSDNQSHEGGLLVPIVVKLPKDWKIGMQVEGDYLKDDDTPSHHTELLHSMVISHVFFHKLEAFGETYYTYNFKDHHINNFLDAALELEITRDFKVDAGINYGLQKSAHKDYFVGFALRY